MPFVSVETLHLPSSPRQRHHNPPPTPPPPSLSRHGAPQHRISCFVRLENDTKLFECSVTNLPVADGEYIRPFCLCPRARSHGHSGGLAECGGVSGGDKSSGGDDAVVVAVRGSGTLGQMDQFARQLGMFTECAPLPLLLISPSRCVCIFKIQPSKHVASTQPHPSTIYT